MERFYGSNDGQWWIAGRNYCSGRTLDTISGNVKRAPVIWHKFSTEWLYRLIKEPKRIKRQKVLPIFAETVLIAKLKIMMGDREQDADSGAS